MPTMDVDRYLRRIKLPERRRAEHDYLAALQHAHLLSVPFENLSVRYGEDIEFSLR